MEIYASLVCGLRDDYWSWCTLRNCVEILCVAFKGDFEDPYFLNRRKNTILIGLSCNEPAINCFCTSFNDSPASPKYVDVLLTDIGDKYFVEITSDKGKKLIDGISRLFKPAKESDFKKKKEVEKKAVDMISRNQKTEGIAEKLDKIFENPFWKEIAFKCVGCGTCTYLCPTCHCRTPAVSVRRSGWTFPSERRLRESSARSGHG